MNGQTCEKRPLTSFGSRLNIRTTADLMLFGDQYNETYVGVDIVRGVPCDTWMTTFSFTDNGTILSNGTLVGNGTVYNLTLSYYFTVESWGFRSANVTRKPMRWNVIVIHLIVFRAFLSGTVTKVTGEVTNLSHYYEFVNFVPRAPLADTFALPTVCGN